MNTLTTTVPQVRYFVLESGRYELRLGEARTVGDSCDPCSFCGRKINVGEQVRNTCYSDVVCQACWRSDAPKVDAAEVARRELAKMASTTTAQTFADAVTLEAAEVEAIVTALLPLTVYGPGYDRSVASHIADARLFAGRSQMQAATHHALLARVAAGQLTWDDFVAVDPFRQPRR